MKPREETRSAITGSPPSRRRPLRRSPDHPSYPQQGQEGRLRPRQEGGPSSSPAWSSEYPAPSLSVSPAASAGPAAATPIATGEFQSQIPAATSPAESAPATTSTPFTSAAEPWASQNVSSSFDPAGFPSQNGSVIFNASMASDPASSATDSTSAHYLSTTSISTTWSSFTKSRPWTTSSRTSTAGGSKSTFVPGQLFNMTMGGRDRDTVYSVPMSFGHEIQSSSYESRKRQDWNGTAPQVLNMMVDLGSSDMWAAVNTCKSSSCKDAPRLFNHSASLDADIDITLDYLVGSVSGEIYWEQVTLGNFTIGYQSFVAAESVVDEDLVGGDFSGLLGLALPANSIIQEQLPGTFGSQPDGATWLDNLFGAGAHSAPTHRLFSLALERFDDKRTASSFGIGTTDARFCPEPCRPDYVPIVAETSLGRTGFLHWRVLLDGIYTTTWADAKGGTGPNHRNISLGASAVDDVKQPLVLLDSGGVGILFNDRSVVDSIYHSFNIKAGKDGMYRFPCTQQISVTFNIGGNDYPVHPLDMSWPDPDDPTQVSCFGAIQWANLNEKADVVLGSSFMRNVYSVFRYPDQSKSGSSWRPSVGMVSLMNQSTGSVDFYAVRNDHKALSAISEGRWDGERGVPDAGATPAQQHRVVSTAVIAACSVIGFFVLAAAAFCAWWFCMRRRMGAAGRVDYSLADPAPREPDRSDTTLRSSKHRNTLRQKSMVDGFSDADVESWKTMTEGGSIQLSSLREVREDDDRAHALTRGADSLSSHTRGSSLHQSLLMLHDSPTAPYSDFAPNERPTYGERRKSSHSAANIAAAAAAAAPASASTSAAVASPENSLRLIDLPNADSPYPRMSHLSSGSFSMTGAYPMVGRPPTTRRTSEYDYFGLMGDSPTQDVFPKERRTSAPRTSPRLT